MLFLLCSICLLLKYLSTSNRSENNPNSSGYSSLLSKMRQTQLSTLDEFSVHSPSDGKDDDIQEIALNTFTPLHTHTDTDTDTAAQPLKEEIRETRGNSTDVVTI